VLDLLVKRIETVNKILSIDLIAFYFVQFFQVFLVYLNREHLLQSFLVEVRIAHLSALYHFCLDCADSLRHTALDIVVDKLSKVGEPLFLTIHFRLDRI
jgi:hypothetical protein